MPAYHSKQNAVECKQICSCSLLPVRTDVRGPAPRTTEADIIDETLKYFKANIFFRSFDINGPADRVLIYLTLYVSQCLGEMKKCPDAKAATKALYTLSLKNFNIPGDANFAVGGFFSAPESRSEADEIRAYFTQLRQELGVRLVDLVYATEDGSASKWWMCFAKRKFLNMKLQ